MITRTLKLCCFIMLLVFVSCSEDEAPVQTPVGGNWRITEIKVSNAILTQRTLDNERVTLNFEDDGTFTGSTSVNQFSGTYEVENTTLTMLSFSSTEVLDTNFGAAFFAAITEAQVPNTTFAQFAFQLDSGNLLLSFGDGGQMILE